MSGGGFLAPHPASVDQLRLGDLVANGVKRFTYLYDMGDGWGHQIKIEKLLPSNLAAAYPRLIDGARRCPPEDCGGIPGFYASLDAIDDPKHPDHADRIAVRRKHTAVKRNL